MSTQHSPAATTPESTHEVVVGNRVYRVPDDDPAAICEHCGTPLATESLLDLHRGLEHEADLSADERERLEAARADERERLSTFRITVIGALVVLYFGLLITYAIIG
jgi:hypothetical protein